MEPDPVTPSDASRAATMSTAPHDSDGALRQRLGRYDFDAADSALPFSARLARENGWELQHAYRVIEEYRRFVYLALRAGHPVTPPDAVDQAWHLHLLYTEDYWQRFCPQVLQQELHHMPTSGGDAERAKFRAWYARTLASYQTAFGEAPPEDIWPDVETRFADAAHFRRVNMQQLESGRKGARLETIKNVVIAMGMLTLLMVVLHPAGMATWLFLAIAIVLLALVVADIRKLGTGMSRWRQRLRSGDFDGDAGDAGCGGGCGGG